MKHGKRLLRHAIFLPTNDIVKMKFLSEQLYRTLILVLTLAITLHSCDDETGSIGISVMPSGDQPTTSQSLYDVFTESIQIDSLVAFTSDCYLGRVTDPETNATTTCEFLAQYTLLEDYKLPEPSKMHKENGEIVADSVLVNLYIKSYYGDSLNSMKIGVYELDTDNVMEENKNYYTNIDPNKYISDKADAMRHETSFAVSDLSLDDTIRYASSFNRNIRIKLPSSYGTKILNKYYEHPEFFKNSYSFIRNVVPGFYFKVIAGNGTMINIDVSTLTVFFRYTDKDSTYVGLQRVAATNEVIQNNHIKNEGIEPLLKATDHTFIKSPTGIFTALRLPIDNIYKGHERDSINSARIVFTRLNNTSTSAYNLPVPTKLLMIPLSEVNSFFEKRSVPNNKTSYLTDFSKVYNSYTFSNIANLVTHLHQKRNQGAGVAPNDSEATRQKKIQDWESKNPDWDRVIIMPVNIYTDGTGAVTSVFNDFTLASTKLVGGPDKPVNISIIYSSFSK